MIKEIEVKENLIKKTINNLWEKTISNLVKRALHI